ncbi:MAG: chemotaxis protein CheW [Kurthia sp.]|nr:chemotaxis protein CheW [Candidatus Kurthia equi]
MANSKVVVFRSGNEEYAISVDHVISIEKVEFTNRIPHLPVYVDGLTKNRGELLPILDFERILYNVQGRSEDSKLLVLQVGDFTFALKVLEAKEILDIPEELLMQVGLVSYSKTRYFTAVANLDERMITIVSPEVLVDSLEGIKEIKQFMQKAKNEEKEQAEFEQQKLVEAAEKAKVAE